jgi:hypothetical protein
VNDEIEHEAQPNEDRVRRALLAFAELVRRLERDGRLVRSTPLLLGRLGDLRRLLFDYEVRFTERLLPIEDPVERESRRIVREAREREREIWEELDQGPGPEDGPDGS